MHNYRSLLVFTIAACLGMACSTQPTAQTRRARWYINAGAVDQNVAWAKANPAALTGWYPCCGLGHVAANGTVSIHTNFSGLLTPITTALGPSHPLTAHAVFSVDEKAIHSGAAVGSASSLATAVASAKAAGLTGLVCDYEPADNYSTAHAEAYGAFLSAAATELHKEGLELGFDVAGWGLLDFWSVFKPLPVDFVTSMTPTYNDKNITKDHEFVTQMVSEMGSDRAAVGIGSVPAPGYEAKCAHMPPYGWTNTSFTTFTSWIQSAGAFELDVWRCDIDGYGKTAQWFIDAVASFLEA